ncbi:MAG TPA: family 20 glycosylhydrolase [Ferruginibacter sp.]|nr:family 20 glycosylhydrolase [Ferruginibacter sp.]
MKAVGCCIVLLLKCWGAFGQQELNLVPMPAEVKFQKQNTSLVLSSKTKIYLGHNSIALQDYADYLNSFIESKYGFKLQITSDWKARNAGSYIELSFTPFEINPKGSYELNVGKNKISLVSYYSDGLFYGIQTVLQLLPEKKKPGNQKNYPLSIPQLSIKDYPRFQYRGMHLDAGRYFMPVDLVKRYIDYLAMYKFNTFHWHLTEDQGWRIEIKKYPRLTEVGSWRNGTIIGAYPGTGNDSIRYGGFYTQEQIKEVVRYAADRYITIIPEIELPGHSSAAIAAYPELSCFPNEDTKYPAETVWAGSTNGKQVQQTWGVFEDVFCPTEYTFNFLQDVLDEVVELFPSKYIHIGGDECPKDNWKRSPFCQQLMKEKGLKDEHELQSYFIQRIEKYINSKGKKIIGWDEILEGGLAPNATVMSWRGETGGIAAAKQQHDVIMTPGEPLYLNHSQSKNEDSITQGGYNPIEAVYNYEPIPKELTAEESKYILGAQGNVWSEYIDNRSKLEYSIFPRMAALAEVLWTPKEKRNWKDFERRLPVIMEGLEKEKINYSKAYYEPGIFIAPSKYPGSINFKVLSKHPKSAFYFGQKMKSSFTLFNDSVSVPINSSGIYSIRLLGKPDSLSSGEKWGAVFVSPFNYLFKADIAIHFNKATGKKITLSTPAADQYPGDGAFTLVNGVQNTKGISKAAEFLGFNGTNCEAIIDLGKTESISKVVVHAINDNGAWVWKPSAAEIFISNDDIHYSSIGSSNDFIKSGGANGTITVHFEKVPARFVKVLVKNWGMIQPGHSASGNLAWLFVDEIEVE